MKKFPDDPTIENGYYSGEDTTCGVSCECEDVRELWVSNFEITRCPRCGRGYKTEFIVWQFAPGEEDDRPTA